MINKAETSNPRWDWLYRVGGVAALMISVLFLIGIVGVITAGTQPTLANGWLTPFQDNWLVVLFKLNAGLSGVQPDSLNVLGFLDVSIMALFCPLFLALYVALRRASAVWTVVAASLPFLSMLVFFITSMAGRSGLLLAGLIISAIMLRAETFGKASARVGIAAGALLLFGGDLATAVFSSSSTIAVLIAIGYVLWVIWFFLVARRLFQLGKGVAREEAKRKGWAVSATRIVASTLGVFGGLLGLEHGYFETLQGNVATSGVVITAIGAPCQAAMAENGCEPAMTLIPNFLITGILAIAVSLVIIIWATTRVQKGRGGVVLLMLGLVLLLVGGGFTPAPFVIIAGFAGAGMQASPAWWQAHRSTGVPRILAKLWPWPFVASVTWYLGLQILGSLFTESTTALGAFGLVLTLSAVVSGLAHDGQRQPEKVTAIGG